MLERWAKIGCENATVGKNGLIAKMITQGFTCLFALELCCVCRDCGRVGRSFNGPLENDVENL